MPILFSVKQTDEVGEDFLRKVYYAITNNNKCRLQIQ